MKVGADWTKLLHYPLLDPTPQSDGTIKVRCPYHEDSTPSAFVFPTGYYFCFGCDVEGKIPKGIAEKIIGGDLEKYDGQRVKEVYPTSEEVLDQTAIYKKAINQKGGDAYWESLSLKKLLPFDIVKESSIPTRQGLMFPAYCWPWRGSEFNPTFEPYVENRFPYPLYICGAQYRIKDVMDEDPDLKALTRGYRGLGMPGAKYRPRWAWGGEVDASYRYVIVSEGPQHALKFAAALHGYALCLCTFGGRHSPWQIKAINSLSPDYLIVTKDADSWRKRYRVEQTSTSTTLIEVGLFLDVDPLSPAGLRRVLSDLDFRIP